MKSFDCLRSWHGIVLFGWGTFLAGAGVGWGMTWDVKESGADSELRSVAFGNNRWVAVGWRGTVVASVDGTAWVRLAAETSADLEAVVHGGNQFLAVGYGGAVLTSPEGLTWTERSLSSRSNLWGVAYGGGRYVGVGDRGYVVYSAQGVDWTEGQAGDQTLESVAYGNGRFVAVGYGGAAQVLEDGSDEWVAVDTGVQVWLKGVAYGSGWFVAVGEQATLLVSRNGVVWERRTLATDASLEGVSYGLNRFQAVGEEGLILGSTDGRIWRHEPVGVGVVLTDVAAGNVHWVVVGTGGLVLSTAPPVGPEGPYELTTPEFVAGLGMRFRVTGLENGQVATVEARNGYGLESSWWGWGTITGTGSAVTVIDASAVGSGLRFYRLRVP